MYVILGHSSIYNVKGNPPIIIIKHSIENSIFLPSDYFEVTSLFKSTKFIFITY